MITLRPYAPADLDAVLACFQRSVRDLGAAAYPSDVVEAWAAGASDRAAWAARLSPDDTEVATEGSAIVGFCRVTADGHLDLLYVDPDHARQGLARRLLTGVGDRTLRAEVSLAAALGFQLVAEETVFRHGVAIRRLRMTRPSSREF